MTRTRKDKPLKEQIDGGQDRTHYRLYSEDS